MSVSNRSTQSGGRRQRGSKTMLACFGVVLAASTVSATFMFDANVELRFPYAADLAADYSRRKAPVVVALGSSRTEGSFEINRMTAYLKENFPNRDLGAFSAAVRSSGLFTQDAVLDALLASGPKPELVIVEVNPEFVDRRDFWVKVGRDVTWSNLFDFHYRFFLRHPGRILENRLLPLYSQRYEVRRAIWNRLYARWGLSPPRLDPLDLKVPVLKNELAVQIPERKPLTADDVARQQASSQRQSFENYSPKGVGAEALKRVLATCERNDLAVVMVEAPISSAYRKVFEPAQEKYRAYIASLLERFPHARYYDSIAALPDEAFKDAHHVNEYGEHLMCRHLSHVILPDAFAALKRGSAGDVARTAERGDPDKGAAR